MDLLEGSGEVVVQPAAFSEEDLRLGESLVLLGDVFE